VIEQSPIDSYHGSDKILCGEINASPAAWTRRMFSPDAVSIEGARNPIRINRKDFA